MNSLRLIKDKQKKLESYMWACIVNEKFAPNDEDYWGEYRTLPPKTFNKLKAGCCWDYCNAEADWFVENVPDIKFSLYFIEYKDSSHTWLGYEYNKKIYAFESSWKVIARIHEFEDENEMCNYYFTNQKSYIDNGRKDTSSYCKIYRYIRPKYDNMGCDEFMDYIHKTGELIFSI